MLLDRPVCTRRERLLLLGAALIVLLFPGISRGSVSDLIRPIGAELAADPASCAALNSHWPDLEDPMLLYRSQIKTVYLRIPGSKSHSDLQLGGASFYLFDTGGTLIQGSGRWPRVGRRSAMPQGGYVEVGLKLRNSSRVPLLCAQIARVRSLSGSGFEVVAVQSRTHSVQARTRSYAQMSAAEVLAEMAASAALPMVLAHQSPDVVQPQTLQQRQPDWLFMRELARANALSLTLAGDGSLRLQDSRFPRPEPFAPRSWHEMTFPEIAEQLAAEQGLALENTTARAWPTLPLVSQRLPDWPFLADFARQQRTSLHLLGGRLRLAESVAAPRKTARRSDGVDRLLRRIELRPGAVRTATVSRGTGRGPGKEPKLTAQTQRLLLTLPGKPAPSLPDLVPQLASAQSIDRQFSKQLAALRSPSATPLERFQLELAELYRPSLRQHYRLHPKALQSVGSPLATQRRFSPNDQTETPGFPP